MTKPATWPVPVAAGLMEYLANETPSSADAARDPGPDRYEPPEEGVLLQRGLIEPVSLEVSPLQFTCQPTLLLFRPHC